MDGSGFPSVSTTCPYCGVGCGVLATPMGKDTLAVQGDKTHPANFGKLCSKGSALGETMGAADRLLYPMVDGQRVRWSQAIAKVVQGFSDAIENYGPDSVAFYVSGQILTEDYYVANKLMKGYIGSANIDTNSRLCMASAVAGHKRAFGSDTVPGTYEDLELADLIVLVGSNLTWCHPILYQRIAAAKAKRNTKVVVVDPRKTSSCDIADLHLAIQPGSDVRLFNGLFRHLDKIGATDHSFVDAHTNGVDDARAHTANEIIGQVAVGCGVEVHDVQAFYDLFTATDRTVTVFSQGVNQSANGTDKVNAIINCHLLTGRIGKPGACPFSITGQPNAMGGREVGGLANQLAAHMDITNADHRSTVQRFWQSPAMASQPGLKAVDLFDAVADGKIKAVWVMATNPVVSMPNADKVANALKNCPLVVVSDIVASSDTAKLADVVLPSTGWGEKDGTVTNSERRISRQRQVLAAPGETRHDWQQLIDVARAMGWGDAFCYKSQADIFREYAALTAFENNGSRDLDLGALAGLSDEDYDSLRPVQWSSASGTINDGRFFADGRFYTDDQRANFVVPRKLFPAPSNRSFTLNTGRIRDQWHTMTRTGRSPRLSQHMAEPFLEIHPEDAERLRIEPADIVKAKSDHGEFLGRALISDNVSRGTVFAPMHWTGDFSSKGRIDALVAPITDPISGQPALKSTQTDIVKFDASWFAFFVGKTVGRPNASYWARAQTSNGWKLEAAGEFVPPTDGEILHHILGLSPDDEIVTVGDGVSRRRIAAFSDGRFIAAAFIDTQPVGVSRAWLAGLLGGKVPSSERLTLLAGRPGADKPDPGAIVCSCMNVGKNDILNAILAKKRTVDAIGACTGAGTNCGSCRPEIAKLLEKSDVA